MLSPDTILDLYSKILSILIGVVKIESNWNTKYSFLVYHYNNLNQTVKVFLFFLYLFSAISSALSTSNLSALVFKLARSVFDVSLDISMPGSPFNSAFVA